MFDNFTKKLAQKMGRGVQAATAPIRTEVKQVADNKVDLWSRLLRLGVLVFLFIDGTRRVVSEPKSENNQPNIIINNYLGVDDTRRAAEPSKKVRSSD